MLYLIAGILIGILSMVYHFHTKQLKYLIIQRDLEYLTKHCNNIEIGYYKGGVGTGSKLYKKLQWSCVAIVSTEKKLHVIGGNYTDGNRSYYTAIRQTTKEIKQLLGDK